MTDDDSARTERTDRSDGSDDLEWRLHSMLSRRADRVDASLSGPALRARTTATSPLRRLVPALAAAAVVVALGGGITAIALNRDSGGGRPEGPAGGTVTTPAGTTGTDRAPRTGPASATPSGSPTSPAPTAPPVSGTRVIPTTPVVSSAPRRPPSVPVTVPPASATPTARRMVDARATIDRTTTSPTTR